MIFKFNPEFDEIHKALRDHGAKERNPLVLERDPPECGAVYVLLFEDSRSPCIRVTVTDKPNLAPQFEENEREYPVPRCFEPQRQGSTLIGWEERGAPGNVISTEGIIEIILQLAQRKPRA